MLVERTACGKVVLPPYGVQKRIAGEDLSWVRGESPEKPKLSYGQGLIRLAGGADKKTARVNKRVAYAEQRFFTTQILIITLRSRTLFTSY